jgi:hypothetical protein
MALYNQKKMIPINPEKFVRVRWLQNMFSRYEEYYRTEIQRMITNQRMYWGINFGQWPAYAVEKLISQGRKPPTFNIIAKKIESQIGSYLSNGFDMKYETRNGKQSHWSMDLMDMMYTDKSNLDWETSEIIALRDFHCMVGYERMFISDRFDADFGNIGFEAVPPTHVFIDPAWKTPYAYDIENYFDYAEMTALKVCDMFPKAAARLKELREREEIDGVNYGEFTGGPQRYRSSDEKWADAHKVITFHSVTKEYRGWEYDLINRVPFPETGHEPGSDEDKQIKAEYMRRVGIGEGQYTVVNQCRRVKRIEVICPTLDNELFLASGKDRIQTNNCNIYPIGNGFYGQWRATVDDLTDVQLSFNKGKMTVEDIQARSAKGAFVLDRALTGGNEMIRAEIESQWNNPAARIWVDEGSTAELGQHGGIVPLTGVQPTPEMFRVNAENLDLADLLSTMPAAMDARTENSGESGKLYQSKVQVGLISQKYGMKIYERHKREKAQAYPLQAKLTYAGYPREFKRIGNKERLVVNQGGQDVMGKKFIINDISVMPEMNLIVTPSASGANLRTELRSQYTETLNIVSQDPNDRLLKLLFIQGIFGTQDMSEEDREELKRATGILITSEAMRLTIVYMQQKKVYDQLQIPQKQVQSGEQQSVVPGEFSEEKAIAATPQDEGVSAEEPEQTAQPETITQKGVQV